MSGRGTRFGLIAAAALLTAPVALVWPTSPGAQTVTPTATPTPTPTPPPEEPTPTPVEPTATPTPPPEEPTPTPTTAPSPTTAPTATPVDIPVVPGMGGGPGGSVPWLVVLAFLALGGLLYWARRAPD